MCVPQFALDRRALISSLSNKRLGFSLLIVLGAL
jgi:hypothetical protein